MMAREGADASRKHGFAYDVFLSFGVVDTNHTFTRSLSDALRLKGFKALFDAERFRTSLGDDEVLPPRVSWAIENARIAVVVLFESYPTSTFCLDELVKIVDRMKSGKLLVCPVFFHVDPSDVRRQRNSYAEAFASHENRFGKYSEKLQIWRSALREVTSLVGWHFQKDEIHYQQKIVEKIVVARFLYNALCDKKIKTFFRHDEWLESGSQTSQSYIQAIDEAKISIIVFSENYAYSLGCLDELVKIVECKNLKKQRVCPIFYNLRPSDVRYQVSSYHEAMAVHENTYGKESDEVKNWRLTFSEVANLKGFKTGDEYEYQTIQKIVEFVDKSLPRCYDVFRRFRGPDTRYTFTGYLYNALCKKGFKSFMDDWALEGGDQISESLNNAIEEARLSIIVFSENYSSSSWTLDELVNILECKEMKNHLVWPIYYKLEPCDVRHQRNSYGNAMIAHENRFGKDSQKVQKWKSALSEVANLNEWLRFATGYAVLPIPFS